MRIKQLTGTNIKGQTFAHTLAPVSVITGDNFAGKSARLDALTFGLLGYHPRHGKQPGAAFVLASGGEMSVRLDFDGGQFVKRTLTQGKRGAIKATVEGEEVATPPVLLDCREYFAMTKLKRVEMVFRQVDLAAAGYTFDGVLAKLRNVAVADMTAAHVEAVRELCETAEEQAEAADVTLQSWIEGIVASLTERKQTEKANATAAFGFVQTLPALKASDGQTVPVAEAEAKLKEAQALLDASRRKLAEVTERDRASRANAQALTNARAKLAGIPDESQELDRLRRDLAPVKARAADTFDALRVTDEWRQAKGEAVIAATWLTDCEKKLKAIDAAFAEKALADCCPWCKTPATGWAEKLKTEYSVERADAVAAVEAAAATLAKAHEKVGRLADAKELADLQAAEISKAKELRASMEWQIAAIEANQRQRTDLQATCDELAGLSVKSYDAELQDIRQAIEKCAEQVAAAQTVRDTTLAARNDTLRREQALANLTQSEARLAIVGAALEVIKREKDEITAKTLSQFVTRAASFTRGITPGDLEFNDGEFGWFSGAQWVSHEAFSGTEDLLAMAGLSVALCQQAPFKCVLMDELGRLTHANKVKLIGRMMELTAQGVIDQFVGVDVRDSANTYAHAFIGEGFKLVELQ